MSCTVSKSYIALYFNASADELAKTVPSVLQTDAVKVLGGGYLASFEVYHQLHCLVITHGSVYTLLLTLLPIRNNYGGGSMMRTSALS